MGINLKNIFIYLTLIMSCFPLLTFGMRSVLTIIWSIVGLFIFFKHEFKLKLFKDVFIFIIPYLLISISVLYSSNKEYGFGVLLQMLSFLIFPLIFFLNRDFFSQKDIYKVLDFFSISVLILILYQIILVSFNFETISSVLTLQEIKSNGFSSINEISSEKIDQIKLRRFRNFIINATNTHTTYQGLWISLSIFYLGFKAYLSEKKFIKLIYIILITVFISWLYLISARMPFLALVVSFMLFIIFFSKFSLKKKVLVSLVPFFVLIGLLLFKNPFSTRVQEYYSTGFSILNKSSKANGFNSSNVRNGVYYCDIELIKEVPFLGVGLGDIQDKLNECYKKNIDAKVYNWHTYNTHNQYAFFWISSGFLGLFSFLYLIIVIFLKSIKEKNYFLFYITSITSIVFLTENLLQRSDGLFFYCFFISMLYFNKNKK